MRRRMLLWIAYIHCIYIYIHFNDNIDQVLWRGTYFVEYFYPKAIDFCKCICFNTCSIHWIITYILHRVRYDILKSIIFEGLCFIFYVPSLNLNISCFISYLSFILECKHINFIFVFHLECKKHNMFYFHIYVSTHHVLFHI